MPNIKTSYGIICCRKTEKKGVQIIMVKKSTTYHFCEFVAGHYKRFNNAHLYKLFDNMTYHEKMDILSLKFQNMWYRVYKENPDKVFLPGSQNFWASSYLKKKSKFESNFLQDSGKRLRDLIGGSCNVETPWEFPKGRLKETENKLDTAIREFNEETGITSDQYDILWHLPPYIESYVDFGTTYKNVFFYAEAIDDWEPKSRFYNIDQTSEVSAVSWISKSDITHMKLEKLTHDRLIKSFTKIIKKYKNYYKT